jgi:hypothetical protein
MERENKIEQEGQSPATMKAVRLGDFVEYEMPAGFYLNFEKVKEISKRLEKQDLDTNLEGYCFWIFNGSESINIFADFVVLIYSVPEYAETDAIVIKPDDLTDEEVERILSLVVVDEEGNINWNIFKQI